MAEEKRFVKTYAQGGFSRIMEIWVDQQTGVNYLCTQNGYAGGITPLLNRHGTPIITPVVNPVEK